MMDVSHRATTGNTSNQGPYARCWPSATLALVYRRMRFHIQDLQLSSKLHDLTIRLNIQVPLTLGTLNAADP